MNKTAKKDILNLMKKDILDNFKNISPEEIYHFSNNLFLLCYLKAEHVDNQTIINKLMTRNSLFMSDMQTKGLSISDENYNVDIELYTKLKNKYIKIIKNSMQLSDF